MEEGEVEAIDVGGEVEVDARVEEVVVDAAGSRFLFRATAKYR